MWNRLETSLLGVMVAAVALQGCNDTPDKPAAPTGVKAIAADSQVTLTWDDAARAKSYTIYWAESAGVTAKSGAAIHEVTSPYVHTGRTNGVAYYYVVTAKNAGGESEPSAEVSATPESAVVAPVAPQGVIAVAGIAEVTISWTPVASATSYTVYWANEADVTIESEAVTGVMTPYVHTGLTGDTTYYYAVTASNSAGESPLSSEASATPQPPVPAAPMNLAAVAGDGEVTLTWDEAAGATTYTVYRSETQGAGTDGTPVQDATSGASITGLTNGTTYYFVVTAGNDTGESPASAEVSAAPQAPLQVPAAPTSVVATPGDGEVTLTWDPPARAATHNLYWSAIQGAGTAGTPVTDVTSGVVVSDLTNGTTYYFVVTGVNASGEGPASAEVSAAPVQPPQPPAPPATLTSLAADSQVTLLWAEVAGATSYNLYWSDSAGTGTSGTLVASAVPGAVITGLTNDTPYYFVVTSLNAVGEGLPSAEVSGTPVAATAAPTEAPQNVTVTPATGEVALSWLPLAGAASYNVYYSETQGAGTGGTLVAGVLPGVTVSGLGNSTTYYFVVTATNALGEGPPSAEVSATPRNPDTWELSVDGDDTVIYTETAAETAPGGLDPAISGYLDRTARWGDAPQPAMVLELAAGYSGGAWAEQLTVEIYGDALGSRSIAAGDLRARYRAGAAEYTSDDGLLTSGTIDVSRSDGEGDSFVATYDLTLCQVDNCAGQTVHLTGSIDLRRETDMGTVTRPKPVAAEQTAASHVDGLLGLGIVYYVVTPVEPGVEYTIYLSGPSDDVDLQVFADSGFTTPDCGSSHAGGAAEQCEVTPAGAAIYVAVTYEGAGAGADFHIRAADRAALPVPAGIRVVAADSQVTLYWEAAPGAGSYTVYWSTTPGVTPATGAALSAAGSPLLQAGLTNDTTYYYVITATLAEAGEGPPSAEVSGTPAVLELPTLYDDAPVLPIPAALATGCGAYGALARSITIAQPSSIVDVDVMVNVTHPFDADVDLFLEYQGDDVTVCVPLSTGNGGSGRNYVNTWFDDEAGIDITAGSAPFSGIYRPEGRLSDLYGRAMTGTWTLYASDNFVGADSGRLNSWSLAFVYYGPPPAAPEPPQAVVATAGENRVTLTWQRAPDVGFYTLYWATEPGVTPASGTPIERVSPPFVHTGLQNDVTYYYVLTATNAGGEGLPCAEVEAMPVPASDITLTDIAAATIDDNTGSTAGCGAPGALVRPLTVTRTEFVHNVRVGLNITHPNVADLDIFLEFSNHGSPVCVELSTDNGGYDDNFVDTIFDDDAELSIVGGTAPFSGSFRPEQPLDTLINLPMDGTWKLYVSDDASSGTGTLDSWSLMIEFGPDQRAPKPPASVLAGAGDEAVTVSWSPAFGADGYNLYWSTSPGVSPATGTPVLDVTSPWVHTGLENWTAYYYVVTATSAVGEGLPSAYAMAIPHPVVTFSDASSLAIPDNSGNATTCGATGAVSRSLIVTQTDYVHDVDVGLDITHTYTGDLEIFLKFTPDSGTPICVELSTDNGGGGDNFTGTIFDDGAAISIVNGSAPFTGRFRPEAPLDALANTRMNGTWTLYLSDDASGDTGTLNSWSLTIGYGPTPTPPKAPTGVGAVAGDGAITLSWNDSAGADSYTLYWSTTPGVTPATGTAIPDVTSPYVHSGRTNGITYYYVVTAANVSGESLPSLEVAAAPYRVITVTRNVGQNIPDSTGNAIGCNAAGAVSSSITVTETDRIVDVNVLLTLHHTFVGDLDLFLGFAPDGGTAVCVELSTDNGGGGENFIGTVFDDEATISITAGSAPFTGRFRPEGSLSLLDGLAMAGTWTLYVSDDAGGDEGFLDSWGLMIAY